MGKGVFIELLGNERVPVVRITSPNSAAASNKTKSTVVFPETFTVLDTGAKPTKDAEIVTEPLGSKSE